MFHSYPFFALLCSYYARQVMQSNGRGLMGNMRRNILENDINSSNSDVVLNYQ